MSLDSKLLESLLHEPEGTSLDFKSAQYHFEYATDEEKSELLKDILAFANSWRRTTAYILIGVEEVKGGRSNIVGVEKHLDDATLHQFVNGKTQRAVEFSYQVIPTEETTIGVIEIPLQERPTHLKKRYGKLREHEVPIRDGSSTRAATPDEIAKMGAADAIDGMPLLSLKWADPTDHSVLSSPQPIRSVILEPLFPPDTFARPSHHISGVDPLSNPNYSRQVIAYAAERAFLTPLGLRLENRSSVVGKRIRFIGHVVKSAGMAIHGWIDDPPSRDLLIPSRIADSMVRSPSEKDLNVREYANRWEIDIDFGDVRPRDEAWTTNGLFIGSINPGVVSLRGEFRGDNLPDPIECVLEARIEVDRRAMAIEDIAPFWDPG